MPRATSDDMGGAEALAAAAAGGGDASRADDAPGQLHHDLLLHYTMLLAQHGHLKATVVDEAAARALVSDLLPGLQRRATTRPLAGLGPTGPQQPAAPMAAGSAGDNPAVSPRDSSAGGSSPIDIDAAAPTTALAARAANSAAHSVRLHHSCRCVRARRLAWAVRNRALRRRACTPPPRPDRLTSARPSRAPL